MTCCENTKLAGDADSADQEDTEELKKYLLSIIYKEGYVEEQVFYADESGWF